MKKTAILALILISLMTLGAVCVQPIKAQSQSGITINADGTVTPSTAPIRRAGNTYTLTSDINGGITVNRSNMTLDGNGQTLTGNGLTISGVSNVTVKNLIVVGTYNGNEFGIELSYTSNVTVANNTIMDVWSLLAGNGGLYAGIYVEGGSSNIITGNNLVNNMEGMVFEDTSHNLIVGNSITGGNPSLYSEPGGIIFHASNNTVYHNNFKIKIGGQAGDSDSVNVWDDGYPFGGNYWSDYSTRYPNATEIGSSGIGNTPYVIDANNTDRYPLMKPFNGAFYALQTAPPKVSVQSPLNQTYNDSSVPLTFSVDVLSPDKTVNWTGYSLDGEPNVTVTGSGALTNVTLANVANGVHSITVYANDTYGNIGASPTVTFTVAKPEPFPTALVATASGLSVAVVGLGLLVYFKKRKR